MVWNKLLTPDMPRAHPLESSTQIGMQGATSIPAPFDKLAPVLQENVGDATQATQAAERLTDLDTRLHTQLQV